MSLLDRIFGNRKAPDAELGAIADAVIDRIVTATDKRLALVPGYRKTLHGGALASIDHFRALLQTVPGPIDVGAAAWAQDRSLRPLLAHAQDAPRAFSDDRAVRTFFTESVADQCLALFGLEHKERRVLAPAMVGGQLHKEVARTTVSFDHPRIIGPSAEMRPLRVELGKRMIDFLGMRAMEQVTARSDEKKALETERALLKARLKLAQGAGYGFSKLTAEGAPPRANAATIAHELAKVDKSLAAYSPTGLMKELLAIVRDTFAEPAAYIRYATSTLALDAMNFKVDSSETPEFSLPVVDLWLANSRGEVGPFAIIIARFPRSDLLPERDIVAEAEKYI